MCVPIKERDRERERISLLLSPRETFTFESFIEKKKLNPPTRVKLRNELVAHRKWNNKHLERTCKIGPWRMWEVPGKMYARKKEEPHHHLFSTPHVQSRTEITGRLHIPWQEINLPVLQSHLIQFHNYVKYPLSHPFVCITALHSPSKCPLFSEFLTLAGHFY